LVVREGVLLCVQETAEVLLQVVFALAAEGGRSILLQVRVAVVLVQRRAATEVGLPLLVERGGLEQPREVLGVRLIYEAVMEVMDSAAREALQEIYHFAQVQEEVRQEL
jgi:hypothetical protein